MTSNEGPDKNVIIFQPPLCFTCDNARTAVKAFDEALAEVEEDASRAQQEGGTMIQVPISVITGTKHKLDSDDEDDFDLDFTTKRQKVGYEDMD